MQNDTSSSIPSVLTNVFRIDPLIVSYIEISLAIAALFLSFSLVVYIIYFYLKKHHTITKNHKRMIIGVLIMCIMECFVLIFRIIYDSLSISFGLRFQKYASTLALKNSTTLEGFDTFLWYNNTLGITPYDVGISMEEIVIFIISVAAELFIVLMDIQVMVIIVWFVTLVFVETFRLSSGLLNSRKVHYFVNIVTIFTIINSIGLLVINLVTTILTIVQRLGYISAESITYVYGLCLLLFLIEIVSQITLLIIAATIVLQTISKISIENQNKRRTIIKILILQSGLFGCFLFEAFAAASGVLAQGVEAHFALGYSTGNSLGILIFACTALTLYTPFRALNTKANSEDHQVNDSLHSRLKSSSSNNNNSMMMMMEKKQYSSLSNGTTTTTPTSSVRGGEIPPRLMMIELEEAEMSNDCCIQSSSGNDENLLMEKVIVVDETTKQQQLPQPTLVITTIPCNEFES